MINERKSFQNQIEVVMLGNLVPQDYLSRLIDLYIDFSFITELTKDLYCIDNECPDRDPIMLFIGYLFCIRSERHLLKKIQVNVS
jgi:hypothetical protein